jgi:hypothetical protein
LTAVVVADGTLAPVIKDLPAGTTSGVLTATCPTAGGTWDIDAAGKAAARSGTSLNWQLSCSGNLAMNFAGAPSVSKAVVFATSSWFAGFKKVSNGSVPITTWLPLNPLTRDLMSEAWLQNGASGNISILKSTEMAPNVAGQMINVWRAIYMVDGVHCISPTEATTGKSYVSDGKVGKLCNTGAAPTYVVADVAGSAVIYRASGINSQYCFRNTVTRGDEPIICPF